MKVTSEDENTHVLTLGWGRRILKVRINGTVEYEKVLEGAPEAGESGEVADGYQLIELVSWACYIR